MSACLPLWLVKYGGAPVAIVAAVDRASAARAACATLIRDAALGDITAAMVGTGRSGAIGMVEDLRDDGPRVQRIEGANGKRDGCKPALKRRGHTVDTSAERAIAAPAFEAACKTVAMAVDEVRTSREAPAVDVRHAFWDAASKHGISLLAMSRVSANTANTPRQYIREGGRRGPDYKDALAAALKVFEASQKPA